MKNIITLTEIVDSLEGKEEEKILYAPYHSLFWPIDNYYLKHYNYIEYYNGYRTTEQNREDIVRITPFKVIKLYFSLPDKTINSGIRIRCDEDIDLFDFLFCRMIPEFGFPHGSESYGSRKHSIKSLLNITIVNKKELIFNLSAFIRNKFDIFTRLRGGLGTSIYDILHSYIILFHTEQDALAYIFYVLKETIAETIVVIKKSIANAFKPYKKLIKRQPKEPYDHEKSLHLLKTLLKNHKIMVKIRNRYRAVFKRYLNQTTLDEFVTTPDLSNPEQLFDHKTWGKCVLEILSFEPDMEEKGAKKIFEIKNQIDFYQDRLVFTEKSINFAT